MTAANASPSPRSIARKEWVVEEAHGPDDALYLARLWHHWFGCEYRHNSVPRPLGDVADWSDEPSPPALGVIARHAPAGTDRSVPIGGGLVTVLERNAAIDQLPNGRFDPEALVSNRAAWLWFGAVDPAWHGHGIGYEMFRRRVEWAEQQRGVEIVLSSGWDRRSGRTSRPLFEAFGFVPIQRFEAYYADSGRTSCPDCGAWPSNDVTCRCDATLWALDVAAEDG